MNQILAKVAAARRRMIAGRALQIAVWALAAAFTLSAALLFIRPGWAPFPPVAALVVALAAATITRPSLRTAAIALDKANGLEERVMTALSLSDDDPVGRAVRENAAEMAKGADPSRVPMGRPRGLAWFAAPAVVVAAGLLWPRGGDAADPQNAARPEAAAMVPTPIRKAESTKLSRRAFDLEKKATELQSPQMKELADAMKQAAEQLRKQDTEQSKALSKLSDLEQKAKDRRDALAKEAGLEQKNPLGQNGAAEGAREQMQKKLGEALQKLAEAKAALAKGGQEGREKFEKAMKEAAEKMSGGTDGKSQELQRKLEELAQQADQLGQEGMSKTLEGLENQLEGMSDALDEMQALEDELEAMRAMKDELAERRGKCRFCGKEGEDRDGDGMCES